MITEYLKLVRLPSIFTSPSNIVAGYFSVIAVADTNGLHLVALMLSSALLYLSGIVFNDYFDIEIDRKERPFRPLPSGLVTRQRALTIAIASMLTANAIAFTISWFSFMIAAILSVSVVAYDYRIKHTLFGPISMGVTRSLNVVLGASPALVAIKPVNFSLTIFIATSIFLYVVAISILGRREVSGIGSRALVVGVFSMVFAVIASAGVAAFLGMFEVVFFANLALFAVIMVIAFRKALHNSPVEVQNAVRIMIISMIILDSVFVSGIAGLPYGLATLLLIIPSVILGKKLYVT